MFAYLKNMNEYNGENSLSKWVTRFIHISPIIILYSLNLIGLAASTLRPEISFHVSAILAALCGVAVLTSHHFPYEESYLSWILPVVIMALPLWALLLFGSCKSMLTVTPAIAILGISLLASKLTKAQLETLLFHQGICVVIAILLGILQALNLLIPPGAREVFISNHPPIISLPGNPSLLAWYLITLWPTLLIFSKKIKLINSNLLNIILLCSVIFLLVLIKSLGSLLIALISGGAIIAIKKCNRPLIFAGLSCLVLASMMPIYFKMGQHFSRKIDRRAEWAVVHQDGISISGIWGGGPGSYKTGYPTWRAAAKQHYSLVLIDDWWPSDPHNDYLEAFFETGIPGFILIFGMSIASIWKATLFSGEIRNTYIWIAMASFLGRLYLPASLLPVILFWTWILLFAKEKTQSKINDATNITVRFSLISFPIIVFLVFGIIMTFNESKRLIHLELGYAKVPRLIAERRSDLLSAVDPCGNDIRPDVGLAQIAMQMNDLDEARYRLLKIAKIRGTSWELRNLLQISELTNDNRLAKWVKSRMSILHIKE